MRTTLKKLSCSNLIGCAFLAAMVVTPQATAQISFNNVTDTQLNPARSDRFHSETWGVVIGDIEGDYWPDVYVTNHRARPSYYRNNGDGTLVDNTLQVDASHIFTTTRFEDRHGAAIGDIDGDGDGDLISMQAGRGFSFRTHQPIYITGPDGRFVDEGQERGLEWFWGNANAWLDIDRDGYADVVRGTRPNRYYLQDPSGSFGSASVFTGCGGQWTLLSDVTNDGDPDLLCIDEGVFPQGIFDDYGTNANNIQANETPDGARIFPVVANVVDSTAADLNNDLLPDLVFARGATLPNQVALVSPTRLEAMTDSGPASPLFRFTFKSTGVLTATFNSGFTGLNIELGVSGVVLRDTSTNKVTLTLDPADTRLHGYFPTPNATRRFYVGYDPATSTWEFVQSAPRWWVSYVEIDSTSAISDLATDPNNGYTERDLPITPFVLRNETDRFVDRTFESGLSLPLECNSLAAADLDNDMDQDLVFVCGRGIENIANRIFENQGDGTFVELFDHGAEGVIGSGSASRAGNSESVGTADFNNDGFIDLFVTNGANDQPLRRGGPHELMLNNPNGNNWVHLELVGVQPGSTPDAIGARVIATTGGVSQLREQSGGYHRWSQNHDRIHFGLGTNQTVDLEIRWPDGTLENYAAVAANQIYVVTQAGGINAVTPAAPAGYPAPLVGDECGTPTYWPDRDQALFLYRDCATGAWLMRLAGGGAPTPVSAVGRISSDDNFQFAAPAALEPSDVVDITTDPQELSFSFTTSDSGEDGVNFQLAADATGCLQLDTPANLPVLIGPDMLPATLPLDIQTMISCVPSTRSTISVPAQSFAEGDGTIAIAVELNAPSNVTVTADVLTVNTGSAVGGSDFFGIAPETLTFAPGETTKSFNLTLLQDAEQEDTETIAVVVRNITGAQLGSVGPVEIIDDDDGGFTPTVSVVAQSFSEDDGLVDVTISLDSAPAAGDIASVDFFTSFLGSTATPGADYNGVGRTTVTFDGSLGETSKTVSVNILQDSALEGDETITVRLINFIGVVAGTIEPITILDDDTTAPSSEISVPAQSFNEADGTVEVQVVLNAAPADGEQVTAQVFTSSIGSSATPGTDFYGLAPTQVVFVGDASAPGGGDTVKTVSLTLLDDTATESTETITIRLINASGASVGAINAVSIEDDD